MKRFCERMARLCAGVGMLTLMVGVAVTSATGAGTSAPPPCTGACTAQIVNNGTTCRVGIGTCGPAGCGCTATIAFDANGNVTQCSVGPCQ